MLLHLCVVYVVYVDTSDRDISSLTIPDNEKNENKNEKTYFLIFSEPFSDQTSIPILSDENLEEDGLTNLNSF